MPRQETFRLLGTSGYCTRATGPGACAQIVPIKPVPTSLHQQLRSVPPFLLVPTAVWCVERGILRLHGTECVEHFSFGVDGTERLRVSGWRQIAACAISKAHVGRPPAVPQALSFRDTKRVRATLGPNAPEVVAARRAPRVKGATSVQSTTKPTGKCSMRNCACHRAAQSAFCSKHAAMAEPGILDFGVLEAKALRTEPRNMQCHGWVAGGYATPQCASLTAAALYFGAERAKPWELERLARYLQSGLGVDELTMVAAGCRPILPVQIEAWAGVFGHLGAHAQLHAINAMQLVGPGNKMTSDHKRMVATELVVYGISAGHFEPNPVSAVVPSLAGAWDYADAAVLQSFADGTIVKTPGNQSVALYTAVYAAAVLTGKVASPFTWSVVRLGHSAAPGRRFGLVLDGWGVPNAAWEALGLLGGQDQCLVRNAGMLSWSALFRIITSCSASVVFEGTVHFAAAAVYCPAIDRHVGGPFALLHRAALMMERMDRGKTSINLHWHDLNLAIGHARAGTSELHEALLATGTASGTAPKEGAKCTKCGEVHLWALWAAANHDLSRPLPPCVEAAVTNGARIDRLRTTADTRMGQLIEAAAQLAAEALH
jgi:hypothetical protein